MCVSQKRAIDLPDAVREQVLDLAKTMWQSAMDAEQSASEAEEQVRALGSEMGNRRGVA